MASFWAELTRRNVVRMAILYVVVSWLILQVADVLFANLGAPEWAFGLVLGLLILFFVPVLIFAWVYELTPEGLKRESEVDRAQSVTGETGRRLSLVTMIIVAAGITLLLVDRFLLDQDGDAQSAANSQITAQDDSDAVPGAASALPIVAVLPFKATGSDDGGFLAAGLHDDLLTRLAKLGAFKVISRTSMMEYAGTTRNMREIGAELGAGYILEGGVQALGDRVRVNAQLIDAPADEHIWANTYDRKLSAANLFDIQAELALAITAQLKMTLSPEDRVTVGTVPTTNLEAYNAYLRGLNIWQSQFAVGGERDREAVDLFKEAVRLDPEFAEAWARLATAHVRAAGNTYVKEASDAALAALARARALEPDLLEADLAWAEYQYRQQQEYAQALATLEALGKRIANNAEALSLMAFLNRRLGKYQEGYRILQSVWVLAPRAPTTYKNLVAFALWNGDCEAAGPHLDVLLELDYENPGARGYAALFELDCTGDARRAADLLRDGEVGWVADFPVEELAALSARDADLMLKIYSTKADHMPEWAFWEKHSLYLLYRYLQPDTDLAEQALHEAGLLLEENGADAELASRWQFARQKLAYYSARGDAVETSKWLEELRRRIRVETKGDVFMADELRYLEAMFLAQAGLHDEAVQELKIMLTNPGGHRFPLVDNLPIFDVLHEHPDYIALKERFGP